MDGTVVIQHRNRSNRIVPPGVAIVDRILCGWTNWIMVYRYRSRNTRGRKSGAERSREMISDLKFQLSDPGSYFRFEIDLRSEI